VSVEGRSTVLYDEDCGFCRWAADRIRALDRHHRFRFAAIQSAEGEGLLADVPAERRLESWHIVAPDGRVSSSGEGVPEILRRLPGGAPFAALSAAAPGLTDTAYRFVAGRRELWARLLGQDACRVDPRRVRSGSA